MNALRQSQLTALMLRLRGIIARELRLRGIIRVTELRFQTTVRVEVKLHVFSQKILVGLGSGRSVGNLLFRTEFTKVN